MIELNLNRGKVVCFDLGGVLVKICRSWSDAAASGGVTLPSTIQPRTGLQALPEFDQYQAGTINVQQYLFALSEFLGISEEEAGWCHRGILLHTYEGIAELIGDLHRSRITTGCLSNTNTEHWHELTQTERFDVVGSLELKMASHEEHLEKPDAAIYSRYEERFQLSPEQVIFFDDSAANVVSATENGWAATQIDPFVDPAKQIRSRLMQLGVLPASAVA